MLDDEKDYRTFLAGDNAGFESLVIRYKDGLIYYLNKIIKKITIAEDLAQDAFVEIYVHKERFVPGKASFKTYLYTIGHHKAVDYVRKFQREVLTDFTEEEETAVSGFDSPQRGVSESSGFNGIRGNEIKGCSKDYGKDRSPDESTCPQGT